MGSKKTTKQHSENSLPSWLTSPYQQATQSATDLYKTQPGIGAGTQSSLDQIVQNAGTGRTAANDALGSLSSLAAGNFGQPALTGAANGDYLGARSGSTALDAFTGNGKAFLMQVADQRVVQLQQRLPARADHKRTNGFIFFDRPGQRYLVRQFGRRSIDASVDAARPDKIGVAKFANRFGTFFFFARP